MYFYWPFHGGASFVDFFFVTYVSCLSCCLVVYLLQSCGHLLGKGWPLGSLVCGDLLCFITSRWGVLGQMWYLSLFYIYKKYLLILPIFLHKNTNFCITLLAFSDSVSPSSIVYPRRTTFTLVLYLGKPGNGPESESNIITMSFSTFFRFLNVFKRKTQRLSALLTSQMTSYICDDVA